MPRKNKKWISCQWNIPITNNYNLLSRYFLPGKESDIAKHAFTQAKSALGTKYNPPYLIYKTTLTRQTSAFSCLGQGMSHPSRDTQLVNTRAGIQWKSLHVPSPSHHTASLWTLQGGLNQGWPGMWWMFILMLPFSKHSFSEFLLHKNHYHRHHRVHFL